MLNCITRDNTGYAVNAVNPLNVRETLAPRTIFPSPDGNACTGPQDDRLKSPSSIPGIRVPGGLFGGRGMSGVAHRPKRQVGARPSPVVLRPLDRLDCPPVRPADRRRGRFFCHKGCE